MKDRIIGIDIGGTNIRIGAVRMDGTVENLKKVRSKVLCEGGKAIDLLIAFVKEYIAENKLEGRIHAITAGFPSPVSKDKRIVYNCPNLVNPEGGFDGQDVVGPMEEAFGVPMFIEKDAVFLLQYDLTRNKLEGTTIGIYYGTGIGNMVHLNGKFLSGKHGVACDLGHIPFYLSDRYCTCGNRGCAECYASGHVLYELWEENYKKLNPDEKFDDIFTLHGQDEMIKNFVEAMSIPLASEVNIFDPDTIVIGGGVAEMKDFPMETLKGFVHEFARKPYPGDDFTYIRASNAVDIGVVGGAYYAMNKLNLH